ncbi:hypothetical protein [Mycoplasma sp. SG1]|uniref:hypothetical protein n=1 Tax=Mycoplasma sp. SG1 TaxID=2810348 RepID=UPI002024EF5B|nr:hypothetical protein [Mycoplasma sp. SG1]URM53212.1 hypothetical protein JRW51_02595 [Mycoplasma sp. SG1]
MKEFSKYKLKIISKGWNFWNIPASGYPFGETTLYHGLNGNDNDIKLFTDIINQYLSYISPKKIQIKNIDKSIFAESKLIISTWEKRNINDYLKARMIGWYKFTTFQPLKEFVGVLTILKGSKNFGSIVVCFNFRLDKLGNIKALEEIEFDEYGYFHHLESDFLAKSFLGIDKNYWKIHTLYTNEMINLDQNGSLLNLAKSKYSKNLKLLKLKNKNIDDLKLEIKFKNLSNFKNLAGIISRIDNLDSKIVKTQNYLMNIILTADIIFLNPKTWYGENKETAKKHYSNSSCYVKKIIYKNIRINHNHKKNHFNGDLIYELDDLYNKNLFAGEKIEISCSNKIKN